MSDETREVVEGLRVLPISGMVALDDPLQRIPKRAAALIERLERERDEMRAELQRLSVRHTGVGEIVLRPLPEEAGE